VYDSPAPQADANQEANLLIYYIALILHVFILQLVGFLHIFGVGFL
jgi:hypothetical protein